MHTVVLGWFGVSALWFVPLFWRLAKSALPGGGGLLGRGTIRLWLGFLCVLTASTTLEATLVSSAKDALGHALLFAFHHLFGRIGTPFVMLALLLVSMPWLLGFRWGSVVRWANAAFGLGLSFEKPSRDAAGRSRRAAEVPPASLSGAHSLALRPTGRSARPTPWRAPEVSRGTRGAAPSEMRSGSFDSASPAAAAALSAKEHEPGLVEHANRPAPAAPATGRPVENQRNLATPWTPTEPTAPAGWLRDPKAFASNAATPTRTRSGALNPPGPGGWAPEAASGALASRAEAAAHASAAGPALRTAAKTTMSQTGPAAAATPRATRSPLYVAAPRASGVRSPTPAAPRPVVTRHPPHHPPFTAPRTPDHLQAARQTPPATVQDTLRAIEENAAQWTTLAANSLARRSNPPTDDTQSGEAARAPRNEPVAVASADGAGCTTSTPDAQRDSLPAAGPLPLAAMETQAATSLETFNAPALTTERMTDGGEALETFEDKTAALADDDVPAEVHAASIFAITRHAETPADSQIATANPATDTVAPNYAQTAFTVGPYGQNATGANPESETALKATAAIESLQPHPRATENETVSHTSITAPETPRQPDAPPHSSAPASGSPSTPRWAASITFDARLHPGLAVAGPPKTAQSMRADTPEAAAPRATLPAANDAHAWAAVDASPPQFTTPPASTARDAPMPLAAGSPCTPSGEPTIAGTITPSEPASKTPVRGHAPTEFEFRAPSAAVIELPSLDLLERASSDIEPIPEARLAETGQLIEQRLQEFKVPVTVVGASAGPVITRFEVEPALGVRGSQIVGLMKDLSRGLGLTSIRVVETIPGKTCMGLELPNAKRQTIRLSEILEANVYQNTASRLTLAMGKDIIGHPVVTDLARAPHMLVAGTTGSGKSVAINAMIVSLLYKATPEDVRLIMIDPKMLELSVYEGIPHLLAPVVTDMKLAANALNWCVGEMERRYRLMSAVGVRNLASFNQKVRDAERAEKKLTNPFSLTPDAPEPLSTLPLIVVVIDELADLMMVAGKKIEELIARLAQKARAAGIHLILATQRPSVDVITGLIKANIPTRVAFQVSSKIDSRTILDQMGAESLLGQGDMLFLPPGTGYPQRIHGAFVADEEVHRIVEYLKQFGEPQYEEGILDGPASDSPGQDLFGDAPDAEADPLYDEAVAFVVRTRRASISAVQRQLRIGYNRAARLVEQMEAAGLVSSMGINGSREVLAPESAQ